MTVTSSTSRVQYTGNGVTTSFSFGNVFFVDTDLEVTLYNTSANAEISPAPVLNGAATYDYTIVGTFDATLGEYVSGANVVFNTAPPSTYQITIVRVVPATQPVTLIDNSKFPANTVNGEFDRLTILSQQVIDENRRAITIPNSDPASTITTLATATSRASRIFAFDSLGNPALLPTNAPTPVSDFEISPRSFGGDPGATDNTTALQETFDYAIANNVGVRLDGLYKAVGPFTITGSPSIRGGNPSLDGILITGTAGGITINCTATSQAPASGGGIFLSNFGLHAGAAGSGAALTIIFSAQTAATAAIPNLNMEYVHLGADDLTAHYWTSGVTITNGQAMNFIGNWAAGKHGAPGLTSHWFKLVNTASKPAMVPQFVNNVLFAAVKAIWLVWTGNPGIEGASFTNNVCVTNDYGFYIDGSGASYLAPGFFFQGNQTLSAVASLYINKAAQFTCVANIFYNSGTTGGGIVLTNSTTGTIESSNIIISVGGASTQPAIKSVGSGTVQVVGGFFQNYASGVNLDGTSTSWQIYPFETNTVTTSIVNAGSANTTLESVLANTGWKFNNSLFGPQTANADANNANFVVGQTFGHQIVLYHNPITADRTVTFSGTFIAGTLVRVIRTSNCTGAFNVNVVGALTVALATPSTWVEHYFDGANWLQIGSGDLL